MPPSFTQTVITATLNEISFPPASTSTAAVYRAMALLPATLILGSSIATVIRGHVKRAGCLGDAVGKAVVLRHGQFPSALERAVTV